MAPSKRMALAAIILLLMLTASLLAIFPPNTPRIFLNHRRAVESIRKLSVAEQGYAAQHPDEGFTCNLSDLGEKGPNPVSKVDFIDPVLASATKAGYHFEIGCAKSGPRKATAYTITAVPTEPGTTGEYAICTDQSGEIWYSENGMTSDCLTKRKVVQQRYR